MMLELLPPNTLTYAAVAGGVILLAWPLLGKIPGKLLSLVKSDPDAADQAAYSRLLVRAAKQNPQAAKMLIDARPLFFVQSASTLDALTVHSSEVAK